MFLPLILRIPTLFSSLFFQLHPSLRTVDQLFVFLSRLHDLRISRVNRTTSVEISAMSASFHRLSTSHVLLRIISHVLSLTHSSLGPLFAAKYFGANPLIP